MGHQRDVPGDDEAEGAGQAGNHHAYVTSESLKHVELCCCGSFRCWTLYACMVGKSTTCIEEHSKGSMIDSILENLKHIIVTGTSC
jgi:hypothetical protein